jgi:hypothetical protein
MHRQPCAIQHSLNFFEAVVERSGGIPDVLGLWCDCFSERRRQEHKRNGSEQALGCDDVATLPDELRELRGGLLMPWFEPDRSCRRLPPRES